MRIRILRTTEEQSKQTLGVLYVEVDNSIVFECSTLELPWKENKRRISCVPAQTYKARLRKAAESPSRNYDHVILKDVPNRSYILIHSGNFHWHIQGCILVGSKHQDINKDGLQDVPHSKATMTKLMEVLEKYVGYNDEFDVVIEYRP